MNKLQYLLNLVIATLLIVTVAVNRDGKIFGSSVDQLLQKTEQTEEQGPFSIHNPDGTTTLYSSVVVKNVSGYGGPTPLKITLRDDKIEKVELEPNSETPDFLNLVIANGVLEQWDGLSLEQAVSHNVDVVSGATFSSSSIIQNVQQTALYASESEAEIGSVSPTLSLKELLALIVILLGTGLNFAQSRKKWLKITLFALNVIVLGFWCGSFLSLSIFTSWAANGINLTTMFIPAMLFFVALVMPALKRKGAYCSHHCPMGSAQELISLAKKDKLTINPKVAKVLNKLRNAILGILLFLMWVGVGFDLMNYEIFSAFLLESASNFILVMALIFMILSIFIHRPYCRFVCPTGALLTLSQKTKNN